MTTTIKIFGKFTLLTQAYSHINKFKRIDGYILFLIDVSYLNVLLHMFVAILSFAKIKIQIIYHTDLFYILSVKSATGILSINWTISFPDTLQINFKRLISFGLIMFAAVADRQYTFL